ncbi:protein MIS12 homolog [Venturia canescens]|uniref:protein MIS12 homolog n=1 Tax=Venturia canescens TaxID=32260 RepID=UPI001C9C6A65|nr:protein MIS12 homolog [Venturia canescens]
MSCCESQVRKDEEYEMQLLGFTSRSIYTIVQNIAAGKLQSCIKKLCTCLQITYKEKENSAAIIKDNEKNLAKIYYLHSKPHKEVVKKCIQQLIAVPKNILLQEDLGQRTQFSEKEFQKIEAELKILQSQAHRAIIFREALQEELDQLTEFDVLIQDAEIISSIVENSTTYTGIDEETIKCVERCKTLEKAVGKSITNTLSCVSETSLASDDFT